MTTLPSTPLASIEAIVAQRRAKQQAEAAELELAAHYAEQSGRLRDAIGPVIPGMERLLCPADGAPAVAEFCHLELAIALGVSEEEADGLMLSAVCLKHRLPHLWSATLAGDVPAWVAAKLERILRDVPADATRRIDRDVAEAAPRMSRGRLFRWAEGLAVANLPAEVAERRRADAAEQRGVWIQQQEAGIASISAVLNAPDADVLDAQVGRIAGILAEGGSELSRDARRAAALGVLANPARALQLLQASLLDQLPRLATDETLDGECPLAGQAGHACGQVLVDPEKLQPATRVYVHLTDQTLATGDGTVRAETLKPLLAGWVKEVFGASRVHVTPVLDVAGLTATDAYEIPERMREAVTLRNPLSVFPFSRRRSRGLDLDHTIPYAPKEAWRGERPPTRPDNLGPLTRRQHRAKTHGGYQVEQLTDGVFLWTTPLGQRAVVTPSGSRRLPTAAGGRCVRTAA